MVRDDGDDDSDDHNDDDGENLDDGHIRMMIIDMGCRPNRITEMILALMG